MRKPEHSGQAGRRRLKWTGAGQGDRVRAFATRPRQYLNLLAYCKWASQSSSSPVSPATGVGSFDRRETQEEAEAACSNVLS